MFVPHDCYIAWHHLTAPTANKQPEALVPFCPEPCCSAKTAHECHCSATNGPPQSTSSQKLSQRFSLCFSQHFSQHSSQHLGEIHSQQVTWGAGAGIHRAAGVLL